MFVCLGLLTNRAFDHRAFDHGAFDHGAFDRIPMKIIKEKSIILYN